MKIQYDASVDVLTIRLKEGIYSESDEVAANVIIDFDEKGVPLVIEILNAHQMLESDGIFKLELPLQTLSQ